jgi:adenylyltransferase/sulfurtransferase
MEAPTDRQERISWWRQDRLAGANVAIIGAGALGNEVLKNLALMGVGRLFIFDFDLVETSNLSRTVLFGPEDVGKSKAEVAACKTKALNVFPDAIVSGHHLDVVHELGGGLLRRMDVVMGCLDNVEARQAVGRTCYQFSVPYIDGGMRELGGRVQIHLTGEGACMECTIGAVELAAIQKRYSCMHILRAAYSSGFVPTVQVTSAFVSALMCQEAIKCLHGQSVRFGHVLSWIGEHNRLKVLRIVPDPKCLCCGSAPIGAVVGLPLGAGDSVDAFLGHIGQGWIVDLSSPFVLGLHCARCRKSQPVLRPSYLCKDADMFCAGCRSGSSNEISLELVDCVNSASAHGLGSRPLNFLGVPPLATLLGRKGDELALFELSVDCRVPNINFPRTEKE